MTRSYTKEELANQAVAAKSLIEELAIQDDSQLAHDMVEGETDFFEAVQKALDEIGEYEIIASGCAEQIAKLTERKSRAAEGAKRLKGLIDQAFQIAGIRKHTFPTATLSLKAVPSKLIISDEYAIPAKYWRQPDPVIDKKALFDAIKAGEAVQGASKSNGGTTIQIRRS